MSIKKPINPFLRKGSIPVIKLSEAKEEGDNESGQLSYRRNFYVDQQQSTQIFRSKEFEAVFYSLSSRGMKLLIYIVFHLTRKSDKIRLDPKAFTEHTGLSKSVFEKARAELAKKNIIKKSTGKNQGYLYWVNPVLFSGNRHKFIIEEYGKEYVYDIKTTKPKRYTEEDEF